MWETRRESTLEEFNIKCKKCNRKDVVIKHQVYLDQGYYPSDSRKVVSCNHFGNEEEI